jgi:hypothetical protein
MENNNPENNKSNIIGNGLKAAAVAGVVLAGGGAMAHDQEQKNKEKMLDQFVVSPSNMDTLAKVQNLESSVNSKYTTADFNAKGYGGVNFFLRNAGENSTMSIKVVFFEKGKSNKEIVAASQGLKTITVTLDEVTAKNKYAMEALLSGVVAKELGK